MPGKRSSPDCSWRRKLARISSLTDFDSQPESRSCWRVLGRRDGFNGRTPGDTRGGNSIVDARSMGARIVRCPGRRNVLQFPYLPPEPLLGPASMSPPATDGLLLSRRGFVQSGYSAALGLSLAGALPHRAVAETVEKPRKAKSVVIVFLTGAASHID